MYFCHMLPIFLVCFCCLILFYYSYYYHYLSYVFHFNFYLRYIHSPSCVHFRFIEKWISSILQKTLNMGKSKGQGPKGQDQRARVQRARDQRARVQRAKDHLAVYRLFNTRKYQNIKCLTFFTVLKIILFTSWKSFVCIHKNYLSIYIYAIYTPPNFISMIIYIESKKQSDYCQLNKPCSTSSWVSKKNDKKSHLIYLFSSLAINEDSLY